MKWMIVGTMFVLSACCLNRKQEMPDDFAFAFSFDFTEEYSSFSNTYRRSGCTIDYNDSVISLKLTEDEKRRIYDVMLQEHLSIMPEYFDDDTTQPCIIPASVDELTVRMNGVEKSYNYSHSCYPKNLFLAEKFERIVSEIVFILTHKKEVRDLPKSKLLIL
jgi:hypothetical protein